MAHPECYGAMCTFRVSAENSWVFDLKEDEISTRLNSMLYLAHIAMRSAAPSMSMEQSQAFQRVYDMLQIAIPRSIQVQQNSSTKGAEGERSMDDLILERLPALQLVDCSTSAHGGDRRLNGDGFSILVEYKDYARTVESKEVDKFLRDLRESGCNAGVFCSFNTRIAKKHKDNLTIENTGGALAVYIPSAGRDGQRLMVVLEWVQWLCQQRTNNTADSARIVDAASRALSEIDTLYRELSTVSEQLKKQLQRLDEARLTSLTALRERLSFLVEK